MSTNRISLPPSSSPTQRRRGRPVARNTFQLACDLLPNEGESPEAAMGEARILALKWANRRFPPRIDQKAWDGESFLCREWGYQLEGVSIAQDKLWTMRLEHPDENVV